MTATLHHRGPDSGDTWLDAEAGVALGHRRLAIVDLSEAGHQPMVSADGRLVLAYNGELYNTPELRRGLEGGGRGLRGRSDTEVLLECCARDGVERTLPRLQGMFAFALWDRGERRLWLARDRFGIKPLYYGRQDGRLLFGSELKALRAYPGWQPALDPAAAAAFLCRGNVPGGQCIYAGVHQLGPGCVLSARAGEEPVVRRWYDPLAVMADAQPLTGDDGELAEHLDSLLRDVVARHLVADVPLGVFLSGGIDSSLVTALMQVVGGGQARSFSIGFEAAGYDESAHAAAVAAHLGTRHESLMLSPDEALALVPSLPAVYDEPFADSSQLPTLLVSSLARRSLVVALSGDGGDELFAGYNRHAWVTRIRKLGGFLPAGLRRLLARLPAAMPAGGWDAAARLLPARLRPPQLDDKLRKAAPLLAADSVAQMHDRLTRQWQDDILGPAAQPQAPVDATDLERKLPDALRLLQYLDLVGYLPDDILTKVDRASMAASLEVRPPLLDHHVFEFATRLPARALIRGGRGKWLLRQVLARYVPPALTERPKAGFAVPIDAWLRGPLRDWAESLLAPAALDEGGLLDVPRVRAEWHAHLSGERNAQHRLWTVLMFQAWREHWGV